MKTILRASLIAAITSLLMSGSVFARDITTFSAMNAYYHYKSGTVVFTEQQASNVKLMAIDKRGKKTLLTTLDTDIKSDNCSKFGNIGISPSGFLVFAQVNDCFEGGSTEIYNLRTGKKLEPEDGSIMLFDPNKDVFFSKDASRIVIRTEMSGLMGVDASIYIQNPKTLKLVNAYSIKLDEYDPVYKKYGDDARLTLEDVRLHGNASVSFAKVIKNGEGKVIKRGIITAKFPK